MAVLLDEATVRISADSRDGEREAGQAGRRFGKAFADGADREGSKTDLAARLTKDVEKAAGDIEKARAKEVKSAAAVEAAEKRLAKARDTEATAAGRLQTAEAKLNDLRDRGGASTSQITAAEQRVESARTKAASSADRLQSAESKLQALRDSGNANASKIAAAETAVEQARIRAATAAGASTVAEQRLQEIRARSGASTSQIVAAENALEQAQRRLATAQNDTVSATQRVTDANSGLAASHQRTQDAVNQHASSYSRLQSELSGVSSRMSQTGGDTQRLSQSFNQLGSDADSIGSRIRAAFSNFSLGNIVSEVSRVNFSTLVSGADRASGSLSRLGSSGGGGAGLNSLGASAARAGAQLAAAGASAAGTFSAMAGGIGIAIALAAAISSIGAAAALVPAALGGIALGIGTLTTGFSGIGGALKAMSTAQTGAASKAAGAAGQQAAAAEQIRSAQASLSAAQTAYDRQSVDGARAVEAARRGLADAQVASAERIADAQRAVQDATEAAADSAASSLRRIADAERSLASARQAASDSATRALQRVADAQDTVRRAQESARDAQESLTRAVKDAKEAQEDLALSLRGSALAEEDAIIGLAEAQARLSAAKAKGVTGLDLQKLDLDARQAALRLDETRERYVDLQQESAESAAKGVNGADQVVAAQKRVADATENVTKAEKGVQAAREEQTRAAQDAAERVADAERGVSEARAAGADAAEDSARRVADAQENLRRAQVQGTRDVEDAQRNLNETQERAAQQQADAALRVAEAQHQLDQAYKAAAAGAAGAAGGIDKLGEAMSKLSPNAQELVRTLHALGKDWDVLQKNVQQELFAGVSAELVALAGIYFPILEKSMVGVAKSFNGTFKDISALLQTEEATAQITKGMDNITRAVGIAGQAMLPLTQIFIDLFEVGSEFMPGLAQGFLDAANGAAEFFEKAKDNGDLKRWIEEALVALGQLWDIFVNVGRIIGAVFGAGKETGSSFLETLVSLTDQIATFLESAAAQEALTLLFDLIKAFGPELLVLGIALKGASLLFGGLNKAIGAVTAINTIAKWASGTSLDIDKVGKSADDAADKVGKEGGGGKSKGGLRGALKGLGLIAGVGLAAVEIDKINTAAAGGEENLQGVDENLHDIVGAGEQLATFDFGTIFGDIKSELDETAQKWRDGKAPIQEWAGEFGTWVGGLPEKVGGWFSGIWTEATTWMETTKTDLAAKASGISTDFELWIGGLPEKVGGWFSGIWTEATTWFETTKTDLLAKAEGIGADFELWIGGLPERFTTWFSGIWTEATTWFETTKTDLLAKAEGISTDFETWIGGLPEKVGGWFSGIWTEATTWFETTKTDLLAKAQGIASDFETWIGGLPGKVGGWFTDLKERAVTKFQELKDTASNKAREILNDLTSNLSQLPGRAAEWFGGLKDRAVQKANELFNDVRTWPGKVTGALGNLGSLLLGVGQDIVTGLWNGINAGWTWLTTNVKILAGNLLNAAKSALGIASPSRLFRDQVGKQITAGLALGIDRGAGDVIASARDMTDSVLEAATRAADDVDIFAGVSTDGLFDVLDKVEAQLRRTSLSMSVDTTSTADVNSQQVVTVRDADGDARLLQDIRDLLTDIRDDGLTGSDALNVVNNIINPLPEAPSVTTNREMAKQSALGRFRR